MPEAWQKNMTIAKDDLTTRITPVMPPGGVDNLPAFYPLNRAELAALTSTSGISYIIASIKVTHLLICWTRWTGGRVG